MTSNTNPPKALSVLSLDKDTCRIEVEAFKSVLNKAQNSPICFLSISGPTRTGKSYLLAHFVRYFECKKKDPNCSDWYKETSPTFEWNSEAERMTVGMHLWSEPYFVKTPGGGKLAVLLLDTQGLFDKVTSPRHNAVIFSIINLCSSVMMFNIMRQVDENILQQVEYFTGYSHMVSANEVKNKITKNVGRNTNFLNDTKLVFIVRDFSLPEDEYTYGSHSKAEKPPDSVGNYFIDTFELKDECPQENKIVRENIRRNFKDISIYCLPHPGRRFERGRDLEPGQEFQTHVISFVESMTQIENLVKKTVLGKPTTGLKFLQYIYRLEDLCANARDIFSDVPSVADGNAYIQYSIAYNVAISKYEIDMNTFLNSKRQSTTEKELEAVHKTYSRKAKQMFEKQIKMTHPKYGSEYRQKMEIELQNCFGCAKKALEKFKEAAANADKVKELQKEVLEWIKIKNNMSDDIGKIGEIMRDIHDVILKQIHAVNKTIRLNNFRQKSPEEAADNHGLRKRRMQDSKIEIETSTPLLNQNDESTSMAVIEKIERLQAILAKLGILKPGSDNAQVLAIHYNVFTLEFEPPEVVITAGYKSEGNLHGNASSWRWQRIRIFLWMHKRTIAFFSAAVLFFVLFAFLALIYFSCSSEMSSIPTFPTDKNDANISELAETLESLNRNLTNELVQSKKLNNILITSLDYVTQNVTALEIVTSDCGGILTIPTNKSSLILKYKLNTRYNNNENCLWTVENTRNSIRSRLTLRVELISSGFGGNTGLFAFKWNRGSNLTSEEITIGKEHELSADGLYISFTSDNGTSTGGTGFLLRITVTHSELKTYGSNKFFRNSTDTYTGFSHHDSDQISVTINPKTPIKFEAYKAFSKQSTDLFVFEIQELGKFVQKARLTGNLPSKTSFNTTYPILSIYESKRGGPYQSFKLKWTER